MAREITPAEMMAIADRIEDPSYPDVNEWDSNKAKIFIHEDGRLVFMCSNEEDAERTLYAMMVIIGTPGELEALS